MNKSEIMARPIGDGGISGGPPCADVHRVTGIGVVGFESYRYRCIDCGHYFDFRPAGVNLDQEGEAGEKLIWDSDHQLGTGTVPG